MTFHSTKVEPAGADKLKVTGDLTIRGVTKPVSLEVDGPSKPIDDGHGHLHMGDLGERNSESNRLRNDRLPRGGRQRDYFDH